MTCMTLIIALSAYDSKTSLVAPHFVLSNCDKHNKMQLSVKLKQIL